MQKNVKSGIMIRLYSPDKVVGHVVNRLPISTL